MGEETFRRTLRQISALVNLFLEGSSFAETRRAVLVDPAILPTVGHPPLTLDCIILVFI